MSKFYSHFLRNSSSNTHSSNTPWLGTSNLLTNISIRNISDLNINFTNLKLYTCTPSTIMNYDEQIQAQAQVQIS